MLPTRSNLRDCGVSNERGQWEEKCYRWHYPCKWGMQDPHGAPPFSTCVDLNCAHLDDLGRIVDRPTEIRSRHSPFTAADARGAKWAGNECVGNTARLRIGPDWNVSS
jgi:hypothetical protein